MAKETGLPLFCHHDPSTAAGGAILDLLASCGVPASRVILGHSGDTDNLEHLPPITVYEPTYVERPPEVDMSEPLEITHEDDTWLVEGPWLQRLMANVNFDDYESRMWFDKALRETGLYQQLEERGIEDGDTVSLDGYEFEYQR